MNSKKRVVITGMGIVSPVGNSIDASWENLINGVSGITSVAHLQDANLPTTFAGKIKDFDAAKFITAKECKRLDLFVQYALYAAFEALNDSKINLDNENKSRVGAIIGSGIGGLSSIEENCRTFHTQGVKRISPFFVPGSIINMAGGIIAEKLHIQGPNYAISTACSTGTHCIGQAYEKILLNQADIMFAGSSEGASCNLGIAGFNAMRALSTRNDNPSIASCPWDKNRDGFVLSDGSGILILEELEHAKRRGAHIYAEITGYSLTSDAYNMVAPRDDGLVAALCMSQAIASANLQCTDIDYINAHATSTEIGDVAEVRAIKKTFKEHAYNLMVSSTKSITGHLLGAAGSIEAVFTALSIKNNAAPPTINLHNPDNECDLNFVANKVQYAEINHAISNSFGFGGLNASLVLSKYKN